MRRGRLLALSSLVVAVLVALPAHPASAAGPLETGIVDHGAVFDPQAGLAFTRMRAAGASLVRLYVEWRDIAPEGATKPAGFVGANPRDPQYRWQSLDGQVKMAVARGLKPILSPVKAPTWAERAAGTGLPAGSARPDPQEFAAFGKALALRYGGGFGGLPRVRLWQPWNEPNVVLHLSPQFDEQGRFVAPDLYRELYEAFANAVLSVHGDNQLIAGGMSSFTNPSSSGPLAFMRALFCLSPQNQSLPGCRPMRMDIWSHHPYASGDPQHHAANPNDVSLADLPKMQRVLAAARRNGRIVSPHGLRFWITEFSWDTQPPDPGGVPMKLHSRWVAEALYRAWHASVSALVWFQLRDEPLWGREHHQAYESGLYFRCTRALSCDRPKPSLTAFRFPFVAYRTGARVLVWGRTPAGRRGTVVVEQRVGRTWRRLAALATDRYGIFTASLRPAGAGDVRARRGSDSALGFSLRRPPDYPVRPFGTPQ